MDLTEPTTWFAGDGRHYLRGPFRPLLATVPPELVETRTHWTYNACQYLGLVALTGLALALFRPLPRRFVPLFAFWFLAYLAVSDFLPLEWVLQRIPGLKLVEDSRFLPAGCLAGSLVAGCGLELLLAARRRWRAAAVLALVGAASLLSDHRSWCSRRGRCWPAPHCSPSLPAGLAPGFWRLCWSP